MLSPPTQPTLLTKLFLCGHGSGGMYRPPTQVGDRQLHLIVSEHPTFRIGKGVNSRDIHFAIRVSSFRGALEHLQSNGYRPDHENPLLSLRVNRHATAGFPQIYVLDPDRNMIEINAERED